MSSKGLTPKQELFIGYYLGEANYNSTEAARLAKYKGSNHTLEQIGYENLRKPGIKGAIDSKLQEIAEKADITTQWVVEKTKKIIAQAEEIEQPGPAISGLNLLAKYTGGFDKANDGVNINNIHVSITKHGE